MAYIYYLSHPSSQTFYIGKTKNPEERLKHHIIRAKKPHKYVEHWVAKLLRGGFKPEMKILMETHESLEELDFWEIFFITFFRKLGFKLANLTDGGGGLLNPTPETRYKMKMSHLGISTGKQTKERVEARAKILRGKKRTIESKTKMSKAHMRLTRENLETIKSMREQRIPVAEIARKFNLDYGLVFGLFRKPIRGSYLAREVFKDWDDSFRERKSHSSKEWDKIDIMRASGMSFNSIAKELGLTRSGLYSIRRFRADNI